METDARTAEKRSRGKQEEDGADGGEQERKNELLPQILIFIADIERTDVKIGPITSVLLQVPSCPRLYLHHFVSETHLLLESLDSSQTTQYCCFEANCEVFSIFVEKMNHFFAESGNELKKGIRQIHVTLLRQMLLLIMSSALSLTA